MEQATADGRTTRRIEWILIGVWAVLALVLDVFWSDLYDRLWVIALLFPLALWLGGLWLTWSIAARGFRERAWTPAVLLLAAMVAMGTVQGVFGREIGIFARFQALKPGYLKVVRAIDAGEAPPHGTRCIVEKGPPIRVAFPWPGGMMDNWCGVVYDPSGLLRKASRFKPDPAGVGDPAQREVRGWFGGDLYRCEPLGGDWYFCCFT